MSDDDSVRAFFPGHAGLFEMDVALLIQGNWISAVGIGMFSSPSFGTESVIVPVPGIPSWALARGLGVRPLAPRALAQELPGVLHLRRVQFHRSGLWPRVDRERCQSQQRKADQ